MGGKDDKQKGKRSSTLERNGHEARLRGGAYTDLMQIQLDAEVYHPQPQDETWTGQVREKKSGDHVNEGEEKRQEKRGRTCYLKLQGFPQPKAWVLSSGKALLASTDDQGKLNLNQYLVNKKGLIFGPCSDTFVS